MLGQEHGEVNCRIAFFVLLKMSEQCKEVYLGMMQKDIFEY